MPEPVTVRLSNAVQSHLKSKAEQNGTSMSKEARRALESTVSPEALAEVYLFAQYGMRAENWLTNRPERDTQVALGAIQSLRRSNIDPLLKKGIISRLSHYLPVCAERVASTLPDGERPDWRYSGGAHEDKMKAIRSAYVCLYGEVEREPEYFDEFFQEIEQGNIQNAFKLTR